MKTGSADHPGGMPRWFLQASLALFVVVAVVFAMKGEIYASSEGRHAQVSFSDHTKTKFNDMFAAIREENVPISCDSPQKLSAFSTEVSKEMGCTNINCAACEFGPRPQDERLPNLFLAYVTEYELLDSWHPCCCDQCSNRRCWSSARIFPNYIKTQADDNSVVHWKFGLRTQNKYVSSLNSPAIFDLSSGNESQKDGGKNESR